MPHVTGDVILKILIQLFLAHVARSNPFCEDLTMVSST